MKNPKLKVIMFKGLPGSGKTTKAKAIIDKYPKLYKRINKDDLREMIDNGRFSKENELMVLDIRNALLLYFLYKGKNVIIDDNLEQCKYVQIKLLGKHAIEKNAHMLISKDDLLCPMMLRINGLLAN